MPNEWLGRAGAVQQVTIVNVTAPGTSTASAGLDIGPKPVRVTTSDGMTAAQFADALYAALAAAADPEVAELSFTHTAGATNLTLTGRNPGQPVTVAKVEAGGVTMTVTTTTAATGPNDAANVLNWSAGVLPVGAALIRSGPPVLYGLDTGLAGCDDLEISAAWLGGRLGLPDRTPTDYAEYRVKRATLAAGAVVRIGTGYAAGGGPAAVRLTFAGADWEAHVFATSGPDAGEVGAVDLDAAADASRVEVTGGSVVINRDGGGGSAGAVHLTGGRLTLMNAVPVASFDLDGGRADIDADFTGVPLEVTGGEVHVNGGVQSEWVMTGGTVFVEFEQAAGSPITCTATGPGAGRPAPVIDARNCPGTITLGTGAVFTGGAALIDPNGSVKTETTALFDAASLEASDLGPSAVVTRS
jgi:adhesin HecA-like repeat protein